jgi:serine/threonine-protein kinase
MPLSIGERLGTYEILEPIGTGGMGEVFRARDTKLKRDVAIKILPEAFAGDAERMARFQREAEVLASLNHPNIAAIYGVEDRALVMELVEGDSPKGPLPFDDAWHITSQIATALEYAHDRGVIHRDLKPANVKVTPDGVVKLLDFGLAKAFTNRGESRSSASDSPENSPTMTAAAATEMGVILGTAAYMSPEQARGKQVDKRADIWAFGVVLYELITGERLFKGDGSSDTLAQVLTKEPDLGKAPPRVRKLLARCLEKDPKKRLRDIGEAAYLLEDASPAASSSATLAQMGRHWVIPAVVASVLAATAAALAVWMLKPAPKVERPVTRTVIALPAGDQLVGSSDQLGLALSSDGKQLAYAAIRGGATRLYLRSMDSQEARPVAVIEGGSNPFFSPDGQWLGFSTGGKLNKISVNGGSAITLASSSYPWGASWGSQGTIVFGASADSPLLQVPDSGGVPQPLAGFEKGEVSQYLPVFLPGGKAVLFMAQDAARTLSVVAYAIESHERHDLVQGVGTLLVQGVGTPRYAASGHLIYAATGGTLMAVPFDPRRLQVTGSPVPVVEGVAQSLNGTTQYSISDTGSLVYVSGGSQGAQRRVVWVSRNGAEQPLPAPPQAYEYVRLSPDGRRATVEIDNQIWLYDLARDTLTRFTFEGNTNRNAVWTPDGKRIAFYSNKDGATVSLYWQLADGSGGPERLRTSDHGSIPRSFSPDGQLLAFHENNPKTGKDIWVLRLSDRKAEPFLRTPFNEGGPIFSPDGHWLAYVSDESGRPEIYVQPYPGPGGKWQISTEGGTEPAWNHNGRELFYRSGNKMMAVDVATQPSFSAGKPRLLFEGQYFMSVWPLLGTAYDVSADGQRFLMVKGTEQAAASGTQINVVLNWFEELKQKVPAGLKK